MRELIDQIRQTINLPDIVSKYASLDRHFKALCPFHTEKHPSFSVDTKKGLWHCFGCGAGGDVFSFIMQAENITFQNAIKLLAFETGIRLPQAGTAKQVMTDKWQEIKERLEEINYLEYLFKQAENSFYDYFRYKLVSLPPKEEWTARDYTKELVIMEEFDQLDKLTRKRKNLFEDMRREARSGKSL